MISGHLNLECGDGKYRFESFDGTVIVADSIELLVDALDRLEQFIEDRARAEAERN